MVEEIKPLKDYGNNFDLFDDILGSSNTKNIDQFFITGQHIN